MKCHAEPLDEREAELVGEYYRAVKKGKMSVADVLADMIAKHQADRGIDKEDSNRVRVVESKKTRAAQRLAATAAMG